MCQCRFQKVLSLVLWAHANYIDQFPLIGGAEMTIILGDSNCRILTVPWRVEGGELSKIIVTVFPGRKRRQQKCDFPKCCFFFPVL